MSEIQINQNFSNNSDDEVKINDEQINKEKKEMNEEELKKEIESTKQKLHKLYEQQWKLRMNKYKEFKKQQQQQQNDKKESEKAMNQNKTRNRRFCHFYQQCSPFYNWYRYSQQQQPKLCEMTNDVSFKQKKKANERNKNHFCYKSRFHYSPYFWSIWSQKQQQQQSKWCAHSKHNYCPYQNQYQIERCGGKYLNNCQRKHSPYFWWWIWSQKLKQRQMQQQSNYGSFEGRKCWKNPNFSNCIELKKNFVIIHILHFGCSGHKNKNK